MLPRKMMQWTKEVVDWEHAVELAALPLLEQKYIDREYIQEMIDSVYKHGPYIVLAEGFALPHAGNTGHIHKTGLSLLRVEKPVKLMEEDISVFVVLASVDSSEHMEALAALATLLSESDENLKVFTQGTLEEIEMLLNKKEVDK